MEDKKIWVPETSKDSYKTEKAKAEIVDAKYHKELGYIAVLLKMPDGSKKSTILHKSSFSYGKRPFESVPSSEVDREMEKTAALFRSKKGKRINLELFENQI
jgi:hypothetical protein